MSKYEQKKVGTFSKYIKKEQKKGNWYQEQ